MGRITMKKYWRTIKGLFLKNYFKYLHNKNVKEVSKFPEFKEFKKIPRYSRDCIITCKIDGTNGLIYIDEKNNIFAGSKNRWLWGSVQDEIHTDNQGFAKWVKENKQDLLKLGKGYHYGEWMGQGIQRNYGLKEKRFYLFNVSKWGDESIRPSCCRVVPTLFKGEFTTENILRVLENLKRCGSWAVPGYLQPEGIVIFHVQSGHFYKKTIVGDEKPKGASDEIK